MPLKSDITARPISKDPGLVIIYGDELGKMYKLNTTSAVIGRSSKCDIQVDQESISRNHSKIVNTGKSILIRDLGSTNGTYVNDEPVEEYVLRDGDLIKVGRTIFKFLSAGNIEHAYHEEMHRLATINQSVRTPPSVIDRSKTAPISRPENGHGDGGPKRGK